MLATSLPSFRQRTYKIHRSVDPKDIKDELEVCGNKFSNQCRTQNNQEQLNVFSYTENHLKITKYSGLQNKIVQIQPTRRNTSNASVSHKVYCMVTQSVMYGYTKTYVEQALRLYLSLIHI